MILNATMTPTAYTDPVTGAVVQAAVGTVGDGAGMVTGTGPGGYSLLDIIASWFNPSPTLNPAPSVPVAGVVSPETVGNGNGNGSGNGYGNGGANALLGRSTGQTGVAPGPVSVVQSVYNGDTAPWNPFTQSAVPPESIMVPVPNGQLVQPRGTEPNIVTHMPGYSADDLLLVLPNMPTNVHPPSTGPGSPCAGGYGTGYGVGVEDKEAPLYGWGGVQGPILGGQGQGLTCMVGNWASENPVLAALALAGVWLVVRGKRKGR